MKIINTQCSIIIVSVVVLRWSAFTLSYLLSPKTCCQVLLCCSSDQCHSGCTLVTNRTQISIRNGRTSMLRRASCMASLPRKKDVRAWCDGWATPKDTSWGCNVSWIQCLAWAIPSGFKASACDRSTSDNTRPMHRPSGSCRSKSWSLSLSTAYTIKEASSCRYAALSLECFFALPDPPPSAWKWTLSSLSSSPREEGTFRLLIKLQLKFEPLHRLHN